MRQKGKRIRRGKVVDIPEEWQGKVCFKQTQRKRREKAQLKVEAMHKVLKEEEKLEMNLGEEEEQPTNDDQANTEEPERKRKLEAQWEVASVRKVFRDAEEVEAREKSLRPHRTFGHAITQQFNRMQAEIDSLKSVVHELREERKKFVKAVKAHRKWAKTHCTLVTPKSKEINCFTSLELIDFFKEFK